MGAAQPLRHGNHAIADALSALLDAAEVRVESDPVVERARHLWRDSAADFTDRLVGARHRSLGCEATATSDAGAARRSHFVPA